jgi:tetratricopeptide (TPR) repeat protein
VPADLYAAAAFRAGQCWLDRTEPQYVRALFAFLRARQDFPRSPLNAELLMGIARCYAELEREDEMVAALNELLRSDALADPRPERLQLDQLLADLQARLVEYPGPVRARVLFSIAQADWRRALRDPRERGAAALRAMGTFERVLTERPPAELAHAARIGMARAALTAGQDDRGAGALIDLLRDPTLGERDRQLCAQILGQHYRAKGQLREAIQAFRGEVPQ